MMIKELVFSPFIHHIHEFPGEGLAIEVEGEIYFVDYDDYTKFVNKVMELGFEGIKEHKQEAYSRGEADVDWN